MPQRRRPFWKADLKDVLLRRSTLGVLVIVVLWNLAFSLEPLKRQFPVLIWAQYRFHQALYWTVQRMEELGWRKSPERLVTVVGIGNDEYWRTLKGRIPTPRGYMGELLAHAADAGAVVITLDFRLLSTGRAGSDADAYQAEDLDLLHAIQYATLVRHVPVILGYGMVDNGNGKWRREPSIFTWYDTRLPLCPPSGKALEDRCVRFGHVNLPLDKRQIPLDVDAIDSEEPNDAPAAPYDSLALATVVAYETRVPPQKKIREETDIQDRLNSPREWVYGRFGTEDDFEKLPASRLAKSDFASDSEVAQKCRYHLVLIGATWMKTSSGLGGPIEGYDSPVGEMPGVYFQANYIEDLIGRQYRPGVPLWVGITVDLVIGLLLYISYHSVKRKNQWLVLLFFFVPLIASYIVFLFLNYYLDFILPLGLCFVHLSWEHFKTYRELRQAVP